MRGPKDAVPVERSRQPIDAVTCILSLEGARTKVLAYRRPSSRPSGGRRLIVSQGIRVSAWLNPMAVSRVGIRPAVDSQGIAIVVIVSSRAARQPATVAASASMRG